MHEKALVSVLCMKDVSIIFSASYIAQITLPRSNISVEMKNQPFELPTDNTLCYRNS